MSFMLELEVPDLDWPLAKRVQAATEEAGCLVAPPRHRWIRPRNPTLWLSDSREGVEVLSNNATWNETAFLLDDAGAELLACTVLVLAGVLPAGWSLRACWIGDRVTKEEAVSATGLAELARRSGLDRGTRYRVR